MARRQKTAVELTNHKALAARMENQGVSVRALARQVERSVATIGRLRSGAWKTCDPDVAARIEEVLNVSPDNRLFEPFSMPGVSTVPCTCAARCAVHGVAA
jgi:ribosome-binding protein aMBF1 (putative translation factor)